MSARRYEVPCTPPAWARGGHAQTLFGHLLPSSGARTVDLPGARERVVELSDGDRLKVYALAGTSGVRVHLFHGLSGDVDSNYMRRTAAALLARGHGVWSVNHRGCGAGFGLARRPYHSGRSEDMQAVLAASRADAPDLVHLVIGFSLSGNLALLHAARHGLPQPDGFVAVNPPVDLRRTSTDIGRGLSRLYELRFLWRLRRAVRARERAGLATRSYDIPRLTSLLEFDDLFTAPECGFESGLDYYRRSSSLPRLGEIETPGVLLTAADDPFVNPEVFEGLALPPSLLLHVEPAGGHVGYVSRGPKRQWLDHALAHYVDELAGASRPVR